VGSVRSVIGTVGLEEGGEKVRKQKEQKERDEKG
jgi:hypothetical protein